MSDRVQFVITAQEWDPSFEEVGPRGQGKGDPAAVESPASPLSHMPRPPAGPDGQPLPGVRASAMDLQLQREAEAASSPALRRGAPGLKRVPVHTHVHAHTQS